MSRDAVVSNARMNHSIQKRSQIQILVVDDFPDNLDLLVFLLTQQGYTTIQASSGQEALHCIEAQLPDLILLDIRMPEIDGYEICQRLKTSDRTQEIPVIFLSASDEMFDKVKAFNLGGADYITKPFRVEEVLARIEHQLTIRRQKVQLEQEIEERERIEAMLFESRSLLASVLDSSLDGIAAFRSVRDAEGKIIDFQWILANPVIGQWLHSHTEALVGQSLLNFPNSQPFKALFAEFKAVVTQRKVLKREFFYRHPMDTGIWLQVIGVQLGDGLSVTFRDITEHKELELALQDANHTLSELASLDGLTQVANRRCFDECFEQEWQRAQRDRRSLALILCDIDYFKRYNDLYGHPAGDRCLVQVAEAMQTTVKRSVDLVARYGGEEFAIVLPYTEANGAMQLAQEIRTAIANLHIPHAGSLIGAELTLSIGVSTVVPTGELMTADAIAAADAALYRAKKDGRDRVVYQAIDAE